ncbi:hypothetical protein FRC15_001483 [Serendipita sp. 397]|nr:hypothetical protein FRC15_001483 [Serendipita sp. 397]KAG8788801.1 hypothetical protein FRC16_001311 [Serendipita sp. 398]KAG8815313.1 hypothetical protein FRC18_001564 [Serendipita sp. 400]
MGLSEIPQDIQILLSHANVILCTARQMGLQFSPFGSESHRIKTGMLSTANPTEPADSRPDTFYAAPKRASPLLYIWHVQTSEPASLHGLETADSLDESKMRWLRFFTLILRTPRPQPSREFYQLQFSRQSFALQVW